MFRPLLVENSPGRPGQEGVPDPAPEPPGCGGGRLSSGISRRQRRRQGPSGRLGIWTAGPLLLACTALLAGGCGSSRSTPTLEERFPYIQDDQFEIGNPSRTEARATGIACGDSEKDALQKAKKTAHYNLRGITGNANYAVLFSLPREVPEEGPFCVEVEAQAIPR